MKRKLFILLSLTVFVLVFCIGCKQDEAAQTAETKKVEESVAKSEKIKKAADEKLETKLEVAETGKSVDKVAATVNGVKIMESAIEERIATQLQKMASQKHKIPPQYLEQYKQKMRKQALERLVIEELLNEKIKKLNIIITDQDVEDQIAELIKAQNLTKKDFEALIAARGMSIDQVKENIKKMLPYNKLFEPQLEGKIDVYNCSNLDTFRFAMGMLK